MKPVIGRGGIFIVLGVLIVLLSAGVSAGEDVFVVSEDSFGDANYMAGQADGSLSLQENLMLMGADGIFQPMGESGVDYFGYGISKGNGVGDFDNDGDLDYIMGYGYDGGDIFLFEKIGPGNQFAEPVVVAGWSTVMVPMDMAVADFNGDGNLDFVMAYQGSHDCGLYLGNGALRFTGSDPDDPAVDHVLLSNTAPLISAGVDAADFNNDTYADFVIAPYANGLTTNEPFYINIGDGAGGIQKTITFEGERDVDENLLPCYGVAAADFDGDGNADIAAAYYGKLVIYEGKGDGTFERLAGYEYDLNWSPLDNYDFDGDGNQDLVAANYGSTAMGRSVVAIFQGTGDKDGLFADPVIYGGGNGNSRSAVSAPPALSPQSNKVPVAVIDPNYREVSVGEEIIFSALESEDEDGEIAGYTWEIFPDGVTIDGGISALSLSEDDSNMGKVSHVFYDVGNYTVKLTVVDDKGAQDSVQATVKVMPLAATIQFDPFTVYLDSKEKWIWASIRLPAGYDARKIHDPGVCILFEDGSRVFANSDYGHGFLAKLKKRLYRTKRALTVRFNRRDLIRKIMLPSDNTTLVVQGDTLFKDAWLEFEGSGTIRVVERKKRAHFFSGHWRRDFSHFFSRCVSKYWK